MVGVHCLDQTALFLLIPKDISFSIPLNASFSSILLQKNGFFSSSSYAI